jgi:hypothetical protein
LNAVRGRSRLQELGTQDRRAVRGRYGRRVLLRCTARLLKLIGDRGGPLVEVAPSKDDWYANVLIIERRKCLLLVHADTLFAVFDPDVRVAQFDDLGLYAATLVLDALTAEGLPGSALGPTDPANVRVARTTSRSLLGHLNQTALEIEHAVASSGGLERIDVPELNRRLRRGLHGRDGRYVVPIELAAARSA